MASDSAVLFDNVDASSDSAKVARLEAMLAKSLSETTGTEYSACARQDTPRAAIRTRIDLVHVFIVIFLLGLGVNRLHIARTGM